MTFPILPRIIAIDMRNDYQIQPSNGIPDEKLCRLARQGDGPAMENLIRRYTRLVKTCARPYFLAGADAEDLMQEGMLGLLNAVREYDESKGAPFGAFARLCITRKIYSAVKAAASLKHDPLNHSMSIDRPLFEDLAESHTRVTAPIGDPESLVIGNEEREERTRQLYSLLSEFEANVLTLFLDGLSYEEMDAKKNGYVTTLYGRRRPMPELKSSNFMQRSFGERVAMNAPIQGTAADIIKIAMIHVSERLKKEQLKSRLILQVHDELLIEAEESELEQVKTIPREETQRAAELSVRLEIDMHTGKNWYEAK